MFRMAECGHIVDLSRVEGGAQSANCLSVSLGLLVDLQQLSGLSQRLQGFLGAAVRQLPVRQPLLQLPHVVPEDQDTKTKTFTHQDQRFKLQQQPINALLNMWSKTSDIGEKNLSSFTVTCYIYIFV